MTTDVASRRQSATATANGGSNVLTRALRLTAFVLLATILVEQFELAPQHPMTRFLMQSQDVPVLLAVAIGMLLLSFVRPPEVLGAWLEAALKPTNGRLLALFASVAAIVIVGTKFFAMSFAFSRDEAMAEFDAAILAAGQVMARVPAEWQPFARALQPEFRLPVAGDAAWVSAYLPGNAAIRAALGLVAGPTVTNAILMLVALAALLAIARRLWPARPDVSAVAVLMLATSSQALFMAMTPYAMSAHLALNLVWLWLFLRDDRMSHVAAVAVGFVATGLHQLVFHPLFVAPFLLQLVLQRRWSLTAFYAASYAVIGVFWILYWQLLMGWYGVSPEGTRDAGASFLAARVIALLTGFRLDGLDTIVQNLLRLAAWQNPFLLVLASVGTIAVWRQRSEAWPLIGGIALTLFAMFVLLPYQGTGWGYRYVHGLLGNMALLAGYGWLAITEGAENSARRAAWSHASIFTIIAMLVLVPVHGWQMRGMHEPYARAYAAIASSKAGAVIVDSTAVFYGNDLVRNDPFLRNSPKVFDLGELELPLVRQLCQKYKVAMFDGPDAPRFGIQKTDPTKYDEYSKLAAIKAEMRRMSCGAEPLGK